MLINAQTQATDLQAKYFRGFGDPSRLAILEVLRSGPLNVGEIVQETDLSISNASNHPACLRACGLVVSEQNWRYVTYHLSEDRVSGLLELAEPRLAVVVRGVYEFTRYTLDNDRTPWQHHKPLKFLFRVWVPSGSRM